MRHVTRLGKFAMSMVGQASLIVGLSMLAIGFSARNALASGFGDIFNEDTSSQGQGILSGILMCAFVGGAGFVIFGILQAIKAHKSEGRDGKMSVAATMICGGAALTVISYMLGAGQGTIFSSGGTSATTTQSLSIQ